MQPEIKIMTINDVARYLRVSRTTLQKEIEAGRLKAKKIGRQYRILESDVQEYLEKIE